MNALHSRHAMARLVPRDNFQAILRRARPEWPFHVEPRRTERSVAIALVRRFPLSRFKFLSTSRRYLGISTRLSTDDAGRLNHVVQVR
jgi:hypothetical protein